MADVVMYSTDPCPYCSQAKALLKARGIEYRLVELGRDQQSRQELVDKTGMMSFPQVIVKGELVGGFTETAAADKSGELARMLAA